MFSTEDLKTAIGATVIARRNAAARLREAGNPRNPFRALPGMEQQFFEAAQSVRSYDLVLNLLEREVKREARKRAGRTAQSAAVFLITAGLIFAAALLLMRCPVPAVSVTAFIGVAVSLGWAVIRK
jgi:Flp pilus assembly protein TadB